MDIYVPIINKQSGGILLLVLVMLVVFVVISAASLRFIAGQSNQTVLQEQEEQAFEIADAGVNYVLWLVSGAGGNFSPVELKAAPPASTQNHPVTDKSNQKVGEFDVFFGQACSDNLEFRSVGYDLNKTNLCQVVDGKLQLFTNGEYKIVKWDHLVGYPCNQSYVPPSPVACSSPIPSSDPSPTPSPACQPPAASCTMSSQCCGGLNCFAGICFP